MKKKVAKKYRLCASCGKLITEKVFFYKGITKQYWHWSHISGVPLPAHHTDWLK